MYILLPLCEDINMPRMKFDINHVQFSPMYHLTYIYPSYPQVLYNYLIKWRTSGCKCTWTWSQWIGSACSTLCGWHMMRYQYCNCPVKQQLHSHIIVQTWLHHVNATPGQRNQTNLLKRQLCMYVAEGKSSHWITFPINNDYCLEPPLSWQISTLNVKALRLAWP